MLCYQCEQTAKGRGNVRRSVCVGRTRRPAALQDLLIYAVKDIARYAHRAGELGARDRDVDVFVVKALFTDADERELRPAAIQGVHGPGRRDQGQDQGPV